MPPDVAGARCADARIFTCSPQRYSIHGGILPGGGQTVSQARAYLHEPMKYVALPVSGLGLSDEISFRLFGTLASIFATCLFLRVLLIGLQWRKCELSLDKCRLLCSSAAIRQQLVIAAEAEDLFDSKGCPGPWTRHLFFWRAARDQGSPAAF